MEMLNRVPQCIHSLENWNHWPHILTGALMILLKVKAGVRNFVYLRFEVETPDLRTI